VEIELTGVLLAAVTVGAAGGTVLFEERDATERTGPVRGRVQPAPSPGPVPRRGGTDVYA
jgi:hypothetical protein